MDQPLAGERRSVQRNSGDTLCPIELSVETVGLSVPANVRDISVKGIGLLTARHLEIGTPVTIKRRDPGYDITRPLMSEVRQATSLPDGTWLLGCSFSRLLTIDDILELG